MRTARIGGERERERTEQKMEHLGGVMGGMETIGLPYYFGPNKFFFF